MSLNFRIQISLDASPNVVFKFLTDPDAVNTWLADHVDIDIDEGRYDFWGRFIPNNPSKEEGHHPIIEVAPNSRLKFGWRVFDVETVVEMNLIERDGKTILVVAHDESDTTADTENDEEKISNGHVEDYWFLTLENLRRHMDGKLADAQYDFTQSPLGDVEHSLVIDATPEDVFDVLIQPNKIEQWIASKAEVDPRVGGAYKIGWEPYVDLKIVELERGKSLKIGWDGASPDGQQESTVLSFTLNENDGKTRLTLIHSGFAPDHDNFGIKVGWLNFLGWIRSVAEYGEDWKPALVSMEGRMSEIYSAAIRNNQADLVFSEVAE